MIPSAPPLVRQVSFAALWSYAAVFADRGLRFGVFVLVVRLIRPSEIGVVILSLLVVETLQAILDVGLPTALIQQADLDKPKQDTAFVITLAVSALGSIVLFAVAAPAATALHEPAMTALLRTLAVLPLINGAGAVHLALLQRDLGFKALAGRTVGSSLLASLVAVALALLDLGAWALVARTLVLSTAGTVLAWRSVAYRPALRLDKTAAKAVAPAGLRLWASGLAGQVNGRGFDFMAALSLGAAALAAFRIAGQMVFLLVELTIGPLTMAGFALLSRRRGDRAAFQETLKTVASLAGLVIFPAFAGLYLVADPLLPLLFGARWTAAAQLAPFLCAIAPALYWQLLVSMALFAAGRTDRMLQWSLIEAVLTIGFGLVAARFGLLGLAAAGTLRLYAMIPLGWRWLKRDVGVSPALLVSAGAPSLVAALVMALAVAASKAWLSPLLAPGDLCAALILIGALVYAGLLPLTASRLWREMTRPRPNCGQDVAVALQAGDVSDPHRDASPMKAAPSPPTASDARPRRPLSWGRSSSRPSEAA